VQREPLDTSQQVILLGKLLFHDRNLSVKRNEACAFCHMPEAGFAGPVSELNRTSAAYPGSLRTRFNARIPQTHAYASFSPVLHYNAPQGDLVGGAFWDMRATGLRLNSPLAEQALWGAQSFAIRWPTDIQVTCDRPGPAPKADPLPVHLAPVDRGIAQDTFDKIAMAIAAYEGSSEVNSFSSKYDYVTAGKARFTPDENAGYQLFRSAASHCNECHRDGGPGEEPLFTDFTASNLGIPPNHAMPYYQENHADVYGYRANPPGAGFLDAGVGGFLQGPANPDREWTPMARSFIGKYKTATLRNVDKRPRPDFVKAYMHNGYLKSLKEVVHFYNTRDSLPRCQAGDPGEKMSCWPAPNIPTA
jgi:cytochrome c peroxidase